MQNQQKTETFHNYEEEVGIHYDAHIKAYKSQSLGIRVVLCDQLGIPVADTVAPMSSYLPNTSYNM